MPPRKTKAKATPPPAPEPVEEQELDYSVYLDKEPTDLQKRFTDWLEDPDVGPGYDPSAAKTKAEAFAEGVRLATACRMHFQRSPQNQALLEERRAAKEAAAEEEPAPKPKSTRRGRAKVAEPEPPAEPEEEGDYEDEEEQQEETPPPAPKPRARATRTRRAAAANGETAKPRAARAGRARKTSSPAAPF